MIRGLLADRFGLVMRVENKSIDLPSFQSGIGTMRANREALEWGLED
jgi:hypothetical protein